MTTGTEPAVEVVDLAQTPLRELNARLHAAADEPRRAAALAREQPRADATPSRSASTRRSRSMSTGTSATTAPA